MSNYKAYITIWIAMILLAYLFRYDVQPFQPSGNRTFDVIKLDRWTGQVRICGAAGCYTVAND